MFSIFVRFFLAFSGFIVFIVTAFLFGANGRGVIGYGTSLFGIASLVLSFNLGRTFLSKTRQDESAKRETLGGFLWVNLVVSLLAMAAGLCFWMISSSAQEMLSLKQALLFSLTSLFYVWSVNGNAFYASFIQTKTQEKIILTTRLLLIAFLVGIYFKSGADLDSFIAGYSLILLSGALVEISYLYYSKAARLTTTWTTVKAMIQEAGIHHLDYLAFNLFPLFLTILLASYVEKSEVGKFNFMLQILNLIFLFSATANIRLTAYVSDVGFRARTGQYKKLFWATLGISALSAIVISIVLKYMPAYGKFDQFEGVQTLFLIAALSLPGYILYQFFNPVWIELGQQKTAALIHIINFVLFVALSPVILNFSGLMGAAVLMVLFHVGLLLCQIYLFNKNIWKTRQA